MMTLNFLPIEYRQALGEECRGVCEIRMRLNCPVKIKFGLSELYLGYKNITPLKDEAIICSQSHLDYVIDSVTERSIYAFNEQIKKGYITTKDGCRLGIAGICVYDKDEIITIKNIRSINVRIPNFISGCSNDIYNNIYQNGQVYNTLIFSPPMGGKTTVLKDIAIKLSKENNVDLLLIDERGEFSGVCNENIDVISYGDKLYSFEYGIRSMAPSIVMTDELQTEGDWLCVERAVNSGVKIIASCHAQTIEDISKKSYFNKNVFDRYVMLKNERNIGDVKKIYDRNFNEL